jgi:predicted ferric reductase
MTATSTIASGVRAAQSPRQATARSRSADSAWSVGVVVAVNAVVVVGLWLRHGGLGTLDQPGGSLMAAGQVTALVGTYAVLVQLLLMSRIGWLERYIGFDRLAVWHRWTGFAAVALLSAHVVCSTLGYAASSGQSIPAQIGDFVQHYPDVLMSIIGFALFLAIAATSVRLARQRLSREAWYALHLYAYLAVALSFAHQLAVGSDFVDDPVARYWWVALYVAVGVTILAWRVGRPIWFNLHHQLRVHAVHREAAGITSVYLSGNDLTGIAARPGQFFLWRFLKGTGWARAHPYSLSAVPNDRFLRITVKDLGDDSHGVQELRPGVRVFAEGPYGTFTGDRRTCRRVVLIAGGIGITPMRALVESLPAAPGDITLLYRVASRGDAAFGKELAALAERTGVELQLLVGPEIGDDQTDRLGVPALRALVPDIVHRDVYVCGPPAMVDAVRRRLDILRVPRRRVHYERFAY